MSELRLQGMKKMSMQINNPTGETEIDRTMGQRFPWRKAGGEEEADWLGRVGSVIITAATAALMWETKHGCGWK